MTGFAHVHRGSRAGDESQGTVVLVHGAGMDHTSWRFQSRWLAGRGFAVVAPDLPGHGVSPGPLLSSVEEGAAWLAALIAAETADPVTLIGHSLGGLMAVDLAARHPELLGALVLVACAPRMRVNPQLLEAAENDLERASALMAGWVMPPAFVGGHPEPGTWETAAVRRLISRSAAGALAVDLGASDRYDAAPAAARVSTPTLVVAGAHDRMAGRRGGADLAGLIPGAEAVVIEGTGHEPMVQDPRRFNAALADFLSSRGKSAVR